VPKGAAQMSKRKPLTSIRRYSRFGETNPPSGHSTILARAYGIS